MMVSKITKLEKENMNLKIENEKLKKDMEEIITGSNWNYKNFQLIKENDILKTQIIKELEKQNEMHKENVFKILELKNSIIEKMEQKIALLENNK